MKTLKRITLTVILIMTATNVILSKNHKIYQITTPAGELLEIISIIEKPVEETIPGHEFFAAEIKNNYTIEPNDIAFYAEPEVDDLHEASTRSSVNKTGCTYEVTAKFVKSISIPEEPVEETIPGYEFFVAEIKDNYTIEPNDIAYYVEPEVDDLHATFTRSSVNRTGCTYEVTVGFVKSISKHEDPVDDIPFDTKVIFEEYRAEKELFIRNEIITNIIKPEEAVDDIFFFIDYQNLTITK